MYKIASMVEGFGSESRGGAGVIEIWGSVAGRRMGCILIS